MQWLFKTVICVVLIANRLFSLSISSMAILIFYSYSSESFFWAVLSLDETDTVLWIGWGLVALVDNEFSVEMCLLVLGERTSNCGLRGMVSW